jgi:hypothetical protein
MNLPVKLVAVAGKVGRALYKAAPKIMVVGGVVASVGAIVEAVKATPEAVEMLEARKENIEKIKEAKETLPDYTDKMYKKEMATQYVGIAMDLGKAYSKALALEGLALSLFIGSARLYEKRNKVLASTLLATVDAAASDKQKVYDALGEEEADKIFNGIKEVEEVKEVTDEKGKTKSVTTKKNVATNVDKFCTVVWTERDSTWDRIPEFRDDKIIDVCRAYTRKIFGEKNENGNYLRYPQPNMHVDMNDISREFKDPSAPDYWTQQHQVGGWDINHPDQEVRARWRDVEIPDPENPKFFIDARIITFNIGGSICPDLVM